MPKSRTCQQIEALLEPLVDGDLDARRTEETLAHLRACPACMGEYRLASMLPGQLMRLDAPDPPPTLVPAVMSTVRDRVARPAWSAKVWMPLIAEVGLVAIIVWRISGFSGISDAIGTFLQELQQMVGLGQSAPNVAEPTADLFLVLAFLVLIGITVYHLAVLLRLGMEETSRQPAQTLPQLQQQRGA